MNEMKISHSELAAKQILDQYFKNLRKLDNYRPDWLGGLEIDRYYPDIGIAIEFQGDQHSRFVPGMHKKIEDFQKQIQIDTRKRQLIESKGIRLYDINLLQLDRMKVLDLIKKIVRDGLKYASKKGNKNALYQLSTIRFNEPDAYLMRKVDRLSHVKKTYRSPNKKKSWIRKLLNL